MPVFLFDLYALCSFCNAVSLSFGGLILARYSPRLRNLLTVRFARRQEGNFLHDDGGELGRGAELSLIFSGIGDGLASWPKERELADKVEHTRISLARFPITDQLKRAPASAAPRRVGLSSRRQRKTPAGKAGVLR